METINDRDDPTCVWCRTLLTEPYIQCETCLVTSKVFLCLHCFAKGVETDDHQSNHTYSVVKNNFPLFEASWTAQEERQLLDAIIDCGYGNWVDIAQKVRNKTHIECEKHYNSCYVNKPCEDLPTFPEIDLSYFPQPVVYKLSEDPPRPADGSQVTNEMGGYMAGRGDFTTEYDNFMELDLKSLEFSLEGDDIVDLDLKLAVVDAYQRCLIERLRRKRIVQSHGLINMYKIAKVRNRFERLLGPVIDQLRVFTQVTQPVDYNMYLESLYYEKELKHDILNLQNYRQSGLKRLRHIKMFRMLKKIREKTKGQRHLLNDVITNVKDETACQSWLQRQATLETLGKGSHSLPNAPRKSAPPLEIAELPGYERLNSRERELCSTIRLVPIAYTEFKNQLMTECKKQGHLKLAQARLLIKIDVNKTRKIYDFLVTEGILNKDPV